MNLPYGVKVELNSDKIDQFLRTGHPRLVGIVLKLKANHDGLFADVNITALTVNGKAVEYTN